MHISKINLIKCQAEFDLQYVRISKDCCEASLRSKYSVHQKIKVFISDRTQIWPFGTNRLNVKFKQDWTYIKILNRCDFASSSEYTAKYHRYLV